MEGRGKLAAQSRSVTVTSAQSMNLRCAEAQDMAEQPRLRGPAIFFGQRSRFGKTARRKALPQLAAPTSPASAGEPRRLERAHARHHDRLFGRCPGTRAFFCVVQAPVPSSRAPGSASWSCLRRTASPALRPGWPSPAGPILPMAPPPIVAGNGAGRRSASGRGEPGGASVRRGARIRVLAVLRVNPECDWEGIRVV